MGSHSITFESFLRPCFTKPNTTQHAHSFILPIVFILLAVAVAVAVVIFILLLFVFQKIHIARTGNATASRHSLVRVGPDAQSLAAHRW
jgi:hypothetical protein